MVHIQEGLGSSECIQTLEGKEYAPNLKRQQHSALQVLRLTQQAMGIHCQYCLKHS